jgi:hypothetical protein
MRALAAIGALLSAAVAHAESPRPAPPPAGVQVVLAPQRPFLLLGTDTELVVEIEVRGPGAETFAPTRTFATVGTLEGPQPTGVPAHFTARYLPPAERSPQVALLAVEVGAGAQRLRGAVRVPLHGTTEMPLRTSPSASVTLRVGDEAFGPVVADRQGHVKIPIQVPPGMRTGMARAVDHNGNVKETEVDLQPAPYRRVLVIAPPVVEVGSFVEVGVLALDAMGDPAAPGRLSLRPGEGRPGDGLVHPLAEAGPGETRFLVEAPRRVGAGSFVLTGIAAGTPVARGDVTVPLVAGKPAALSLSPSMRRLVIGGGAQSRVVVSAHDQFGNPTSADHCEAAVDGAPFPVRITAGGLGMLIVPPPTYYDGKDRMVVEVRLGKAHARQEIFLTGGSPATLSLEPREPRVVADGRRGTELRVRAFDRNGTPTIVPGLSWDTPGGRIKSVRMPREGEYLAEFVPERARAVHREQVSVTAGAELRAVAAVEVTPAPVRVALGARVGAFWNLGEVSGPVAFVEALTPVPKRSTRFLVGLAGGYLGGDLRLRPAAGTTRSRLVIDQFPIMAVARFRFIAPAVPELAAGMGAGVSLASTRLTPDVDNTSGETLKASAWSVALMMGGEAAFPLRPGRLVLGARYLWVDLGRTSRGDYVRGNSAGLMADLGYRMIW